MKQKSKQLLNALRKNARTTLTQINRSTDIPVTTLFDHYFELRKNYINRHSSVLDYRRLGFHCRNIIILEDDSEVLWNLLAHPFVNNIYRLKQDQLMAEIITPSMKEFHELVLFLEDRGFPTTKKFEIIDELDYERFLI